MLGAKSTIIIITEWVFTVDQRINDVTQSVCPWTMEHSSKRLKIVIRQYGFGGKIVRIQKRIMNITNSIMFSLSSAKSVKLYLFGENDAEL